MNGSLFAAPLPSDKPKRAEALLCALCTASLVAYLCTSVGVRAFVHEVARLSGKFLE